ncbi:MAG: phosphoribosylformylglycinamidine synthase [Desulfobulbaceae bacterium]|nr:phosphoribosylformylglycinamidine synthase [Desulfobulbaceae bacterium]
MGATVVRLYGKRDGQREYCFNIECCAPLSEEELQKLRLTLSEGFLPATISSTPHLTGERVVEMGPRLNFATAWSSNMVSICSAIGLNSVTRVERSRRYLVPNDIDLEQFIADNHDRMTECHYSEPLTGFATGIVPEAVYDIDLINKGPEALSEIPGISMDDWDRNFYYDYFVTKHKRNPTIVEIMDLNNANSEHSRHSYFRGKQVVDGKELDDTLFDLVTATLEANPKGSIIAFKDNSSVVAGHDIKTIKPENPGKPSKFISTEEQSHVLLTAETHNFPTGVAPFPGAETGAGGRIRDVQGTGRGGYVIAGTAGYCVGSLNIPNYNMKWENSYSCPSNLASALNIEIEASNGASDYGNKFGEPLIQGFTRSFDLRLENGERWGFLKPIMFTGGIGRIDGRLVDKNKEEKGMLIVQVGGPAYRVGFGGGAASSMLQGENVSDLDFDAVQRGDAEMEQKMNRVIRACNEMGDKTLIEVIHDQGAGGPANVLKELVEKSGGRIEIRNIKVGDPTMSVLEIYVAEFQERNGFLISPANIEEFKSICQREKVNCEVLGEVTGDLRFVVHDEQDDSTPVDVELSEVLGNIPQKTFTDEHVAAGLTPLVLPNDLTVRDALHDVLRMVSVGSKRFLTNKVDRAVSGLIAGQQCCGPLQLTVADVAVVAQSHFSKAGGATAIGEQPIKMVVDPAAGARMAVGESLTNLVWARIEDPEQIKCSANWMWAPKLPGEGAAINDAALAVRDAMIAVGMAVDGGKDSLSMATMVGDEVVKSPRQLVISAYAAMPDIGKKVTPDIKHPGNSAILYVDLSTDKNRLGGTALAQVLGTLGDETPDMDDPGLVKRAFAVVQQLLNKGSILSGHDRSDGGLITTLLEMAFSGNCGIRVTLTGSDSALATCFSEELGLVLEVAQDQVDEVLAAFRVDNIPCARIGETLVEKEITITHNDQVVLEEDMRLLRSWWEETSYQLERLQADPACAEQEKELCYDRQGPKYHLSFTPELTSSEIMNKPDKPKVAILRDEGSNSDREMTSAFYAAGFEPWDVSMTDFLEDRVNLDQFRGLAAVGGFSYADVPESAKGWAATILFNDKLKAMFQAFYERPDTFTFGICNGCQLFGLLGWVPFQGLDSEQQPRFVRNVSGRFESRWSTVKVLPSKSIMLKGMEELVFGIHVDHGEGRLHFPESALYDRITDEGLAPLVYADDNGNATEDYPFNPNGSPGGLAGLCSPDGRHLAMMPHPERVFLPWQAHWLPEEMKGLVASPWLKMFQNAYDWCVK